MRSSRWVLIVDGLLALGAWAALALLMNSVPPGTFTQGLFLAILGLAVGLTALPLAHALGDRWATPLGRRGNLQRAARQGAIAGLLAAVLMGLRLLRVLNIWVALALIMAAVVVEALLRLRFR